MAFFTLAKVGVFIFSVKKPQTIRKGFKYMTVSEFQISKTSHEFGEVCTMDKISTSWTR